MYFFKVRVQVKHGVLLGESVLLSKNMKIYPLKVDGAGGGGCVGSGIEWFGGLLGSQWRGLLDKGRQWSWHS